MPSISGGKNVPAAKSNGYNPGGLELDLLPVRFLPIL
jgi:hypothetical protein